MKTLVVSNFAAKAQFSITYQGWNLDGFILLTITSTILELSELKTVVVSALVWSFLDFQLLGCFVAPVSVSSSFGVERGLWCKHSCLKSMEL
jgi:hypothetical protein